LVESRKNGQKVRRIIWWDYLVESIGFSRLPPAHPPARGRPTPPAPRALGSGHPAPQRGAPFSIRRPLALFRCRSPINNYWYPPVPTFLVVDRNFGFLKPQMIPPGQTTNAQGQHPRHMFCCCQQMASHLAALHRCLGQPRRHLRRSAAVSRPSCTEGHQTIAPFHR
jgi:hypothetical protein